MRLKEESDEPIQLEKLFTMYQFESVEYFGLKDPINIEWFSKNLQSVFKNVQILRKTEKKNQICERLTLQDLPCFNENTIYFLNIPKYIPPEIVSNVMSEKEITCIFKTPYKCNNHVVNKIISFHRNGVWGLECANKRIYLSSLKIYPKYISSKTGIETILKITDTLKMCEGVKINTLKSVACTRFQTVEHTTDDEEKENCSTINRIIRST